MFSTLHLPHLPLEAILRFRPELRLVPCAVIDHHDHDSRTTAPLLALNRRAAKHQLTPGISATQALARCPDITLLSRQPDTETQALHDILHAVLAITPTLESNGTDSLTLAVAAIPRARTHPAEWLLTTLESLASLGLPARLSLAHHPDLARLAALHPSTSATLSFAGPEPVTRPPSQPVPTHSSHLLHLPLTLAAHTPAPVPDEILQTLAHWGIHTLGDLAALPADQLVARLGPAIHPILTLLQLPSPRPIHVLEKAENYAQSIDSEFSIKNQETLVFLINRMLQSIVSNATMNQRVAAELHLVLRLENGDVLRRSFRLPEPSCRPEHLLRPLQTHLEHLELPAPVKGLDLDITPVRPHASELGLFDRALRHPHRLADTLARLESMLGPDSVGIPLAANSHRPDDFQLRSFPVSGPVTELRGVPDLRGSVLPLRRYRPPMVIAVAGDSGSIPRPLALLTGPRRGTVARTRGPFPFSGDWWDPTAAWQQIEWDLELNTGHLVRLAFIPPDQWRLEGGYE